MSTEKLIERKQISSNAARKKKFGGMPPQREGIIESAIARRKEFLKIINNLKKVGENHSPPWLDIGHDGECKMGELVRLSKKLADLVKKMEPDDAKWALGEVNNTHIPFFDFERCVTHHMRKQTTY